MVLEVLQVAVDLKVQQEQEAKVVNVDHLVHQDYLETQGSQEPLEQGALWDLVALLVLLVRMAPLEILEPKDSQGQEVCIFVTLIIYLKFNGENNTVIKFKFINNTYG